MEVTCQPETTQRVAPATVTRISPQPAPLSIWDRLEDGLRRNKFARLLAASFEGRDPGIE